MRVIWCVFVRADGEFKHARPNDGGRIAWSLDDWATIDQEAADQFCVPDAESRTVQQQFIRACGLTPTRR